ncbi:MAG: hypothetical protein F6K00_24025 [Leptolyngbya sp. SIOISBB]|nr:hypothetical protein [Leptolyngbya sp. SIOISBB]
MPQSHSPPSASLETSWRPESEQFYSHAAAEAILGKALDLRATDRFSAQQLQEMAAELDIAPEILAAAVADWHTRQPAEPKSRTIALSQIKPWQRRQWGQYAIASILMLAIDLVTTGMLTWSIYPVMGWGLGLLFGGCDRPDQSSKSS